MTTSRADTPILITFCDLTRYTVNAARTPDRELGDLMDAHYEHVGERLGAAGGRVVKFIGDATLAVFPAEQADAGVRALLELRRDVDAWFAARGWDSRLIVKVHFGSAAAGDYGVRGDKRYDLLGSAVNLCATLPSRGIALSPEAFRRLAPETRKAFQKHTPPMVYIPVGDPRP